MSLARKRLLRFGAALLCGCLLSSGPASAQTVERAVEDAFWESVKGCTSAGEVEAYLEEFPKGRYVGAARACLARLQAGQTWEELVKHARKGHIGVLGLIEARAAQRNPIAQVFLATLYEYNSRVNPRWARYRNESASIGWYRQAAELDYAVAQNWMGGTLSNRGDGAKAFLYFQKAADQGYAPAQFNVALRYKWGKFTPRNLTAYEMWLRRAASQDHGPAHYQLGWHYISGVEKNPNKEKRRRLLIQGYFHLSRALQMMEEENFYHGDSVSIPLQEEVTEKKMKERMNRSEIDAVKRLLEAWRPKPPPSHAGHVREVQQLLKRMGYSVCPIDGIWGYCTMRAYYRYLQDIGVAPEHGSFKVYYSNEFFVFTRESLMALRKSARLRR